MLNPVGESYILARDNTDGRIFYNFPSGFDLNALNSALPLPHKKLGIRHSDGIDINGKEYSWYKEYEWKSIKKPLKLSDDYQVILITDGVFSSRVENYDGNETEQFVKWLNNQLKEMKQLSGDEFWKFIRDAIIKQIFQQSIGEIEDYTPKTSEIRDDTTMIRITTKK